MAQETKSRPDDVREASVTEALAIIAEHGVERLSLREVARRLGVSHQAPYKHFPSRDHLLAEAVARAFTSFADHLDARQRSDDPALDLDAMGHAYLGFALERPLEYRLMFGTALPEPAEHPTMLGKARHAFSLLELAIRRLHAAQGRDDPDLAARDALHVWATMHGLAGILRNDVLSSLEISPEVISSSVRHTFRRLSMGLAAELPESGPAPQAVANDAGSH